MRSLALTTFLLTAALRVTAQTADPSVVAQVLQQVEDIPTTAGKFNFFQGRDYVFDFDSDVGVVGGAGGNLTIANVADFPYLFGKGMALSVGRMAPCGLASPHYHPRAAEFLYMLTGTSIQAGFILENGARLVQNTLAPGQAMLFPKNSFHYQANTGCDHVTFVAGWNHEDPGAAFVGQRFFGIPPNVTDVILGDIGIDEAVRIAQSIPDSFAIGLQSCLDACKLTPSRASQPKTQQQPRVIGNGFTSGNSTRREESELSKRAEEDETPVFEDEEIPTFEEDELFVEPLIPVAPPSDDYAYFLAAANAEALRELVVLLKAVILVMLSGYVFTWVYFVLPALRRSRASVTPPAPVQGAKA